LVLPILQVQWVSPGVYGILVDRWVQAIAKTPHGVHLAIANADLHAHHHGSTPPEHYWSPIHVTRLKPQPNEP
jgi:hypothetical protein